MRSVILSTLFSFGSAFAAPSEAPATYGQAEAQLIEAWERLPRLLALCTDLPGCIGERKEYEGRLKEAIETRGAATFQFENRCLGAQIVFADLSRDKIFICRNNIWAEEKPRFDVRESYAVLVEGLEVLIGPSRTLPHGKRLATQIRALEFAKDKATESIYPTMPSLKIIQREALGKKTFGTFIVDHAGPVSLEKALLALKPCETKQDVTVAVWALGADWDRRFLTTPLVRGTAKVLCAKGTMYLGKYRAAVLAGRAARVDVAFEGLKAQPGH